jgi:hypothetical protein
MGTEFVFDHPVVPQVENQRVELTTLRPDGVGIAPSGIEKDAAAGMILELEITITVEVGEILEARPIEANDIRLGQGHPRLQAADMAAMTGAWIFHWLGHAAIVHHFAHLAYLGSLSKIGRSPTASYHDAREPQ